MRADYATRYNLLYNKHWWWRARRDLILDVLVAYEPPQGWERILDVGCGDGLFFDDLLRFGDVEGIESDVSLISHNGPHRARIHVGSFDRTQALRRGFSLILMLDVLEHIEDPKSALEYASELLVPGGTLLITVPAFNVLWTNHDILNQHYTRYTLQTFRKLASETKLSIAAEGYFFHWLYPVKLITRTFEKAFKRPPTPARVPNKLLNKFLYRVSRFEQMVCRDRQLPFGSSLLVLAKTRESHAVG